MRAVNYLELLFPDFALIVLGYVLCRFTPINRSVWQSVEQLVYYLLFPVLLFHSITRNPIQWGDASQLLGAGVLGGLLGIALTYGLPYLPFLGRRIDLRSHASAAQVAFRFNSFIALAYYLQRVEEHRKSFNQSLDRLVQLDRSSAAQARAARTAADE